MNGFSCPWRVVWVREQYKDGRKDQLEIGFQKAAKTLFWNWSHILCSTKMANGPQHVCSGSSYLLSFLRRWFQTVFQLIHNIFKDIVWIPNGSVIWKPYF